MKKNDLEMAWNEPKDYKRDPENNRNRNSEGPLDLDALLSQLKRRFFGSGYKRGSSSNQRNAGLGLLMFIFPILLMIWLASGIYVVDAGKRGVVLFFGKKQSITGPGIHWRFPSPVGSHRLIDIERRFSQKIGGSNTGNGSVKEAMMLTKDEAIVDIRIEVQYQIDAENPERYWFASIDPDETLRDVVESAVRERVGQTNLDDVLTSGRELLMADAKDLAQSVLDRYQIGLIITNVNLEDAQAPEPVQAAFSDAIRAREDEQRRRNQGEAYERKVVLEAEGEAAREIANAEAYRDSIIAQAKGEAARFSQLLVAYENAPEVTRQRLYLETMEEVFGRTQKILMDAKDNNNLMMMPLEQMFKRAAEQTSTESSNNTTKHIMVPQAASTPATATPVESRPSSSGVRFRPRTRDRY